MYPYRAIGACLAWFTLVAQYWLNIQELGLASATTTFFGFFTILSNIAVALSLTAPLLSQPGPLRLFLRPGVRTAVAVYIFVTGSIFYLLLRHIYDPKGLGWLLNIFLHYVMPISYILDWACFTPKRGLSYRSVPYWLIFPLLYAFWALGRGALTGFYTYPFLDVHASGGQQVTINIACLTAMFIILCVGFIALGRVLPAAQERREI